MSPTRGKGPPIAIMLLLLFTVVPLIELFLLVWLAKVTSFWFTVFVVLVSGIVGASMARHQGARVWFAARREMSMGRFPADSLIDGLIILIGGALLVTPGVLTDVAGFSTLFPPLRRLYKTELKRRFKNKVRAATGTSRAGGGFRVYTSGGGGPRRESEPPPQPASSPFEDKSPYSRLSETEKDGG